jgi:rod shape-determining protein MreC
MHSLFIFFRRFSFQLLFVFLMVVSFVLIIQNNYYHKTIVINSTNSISGNLLEAVNYFTDYLALKHANEQLVRENARLLAKLPEYIHRTDSLDKNTEDSLVARKFYYLPAKVISNSINRQNNYLKINKGANDGVGLNMAVIAPDGVVGQVVEISRHFSSVMSLINSHSRISAKLKSSNQMGSVLWDGNDYRFVKMTDVPAHVNIGIGDTVVTSGFSHIYPEGRLIGFVEGFSIEPGENFWALDVRLSVDFNKLSWVYIVSNRFIDELRQLEEAEINN